MSTEMIVKQNDQKDKKFQPPTVPMYVQCDGFRCLAYRDEGGGWKNFHSREALLGDVRLLPYSVM